MKLILQDQELCAKKYCIVPTKFIKDAIIKIYQLTSKPMLRRVKFDLVSGDRCPYCKIGEIVERTGKYGPFHACSQYPGCCFIQQIVDNAKGGNDLDMQADQFLESHGINMPRI